MNYFCERIKKYSKRIRFAIYCFSFGDNDRFVQTVKNIEKDNNLVYLEEYGSDIAEGTLYHIKAEYSGSGFFADHNRLLNYLFFADKYGLKPVVEYHPDYCYAEKEAVNGTTNPFEYYFEQPCGISLDTLYHCNCVLRSRKNNTKYAIELNENNNGYSRNNQYIEEMGRITRKYLRLRKEVDEYIARSIAQIISSEDKVLAVHFRGTDFKKNYNGHPVNLSIEDYYLKIEEALTRGYNKIFLATDDCEAIYKMKERYRDKLVYYTDVVRSNGNETVMNSVCERNHHHYLLGLEVLRDMFTLARGDGLIAGLSQVSLAARIQKASLGQSYNDLFIIDKGINYHGKYNCPKT